MKIQANSCAEREMEQVEHPLFTSQKEEFSSSTDGCLWTRVQITALPITAVPALPGDSHSRLWVCRGSGRKSQPRTQIYAFNLLAVI